MADVTIHSLKALAIFKTLFESGSASQAARTLEITQSGVSRSLAQLEKNLGIQLFFREKNRLVATPEAAELYEEILQLMGNIEELRHSVLALKEFGTSRLRIASVPGLSFGFVPRIIAALLQVNPNLSVGFDMMSSHEVLRSVESSHADIGLVTLPVTSRVLGIEEWFTTPAVCLLPQGHALSGRDTIDVKDLQDQHIVISNQPNIGADPLLNLVTQHGVHISGKTEANIGTIPALVKYTIGVSVMNPVTAQDLADHDDRFVIRPFTPQVDFRFGIVYRRSWKQTQALHTIRERGKAFSQEYRHPERGPDA